MADDSRSVSIVIDAVNNASKVFDDVAKDAKNLGGSIGGFLKQNVVQLGAAFAATSGYVYSNIQAYVEAENAVTRLDSVVKNMPSSLGLTTDALTELAAKLQDTSTYSDEAIMQAETIIASFGKIGKDTFPQVTQATVDVASALGLDLTAAAKLVGGAISEPLDALNRLRKAGVFFSDDQEKVIKSLAESGKVAEAQSMILDTLSGKYKGAGEAAANTFGGKLEVLKNNINDVQETLGLGLIKSLEQVGLNFDTLTSKVEVLNQFMMTHGDVLLAVSAVALVLVGVFGVLLVAALIAMAGTAGIVIGAIGILIAGIVALGAVVAYHWQAIVYFTQLLWTQITTAFASIMATIGATISFIIAYMEMLWQQVLFFWNDLWMVQIPFILNWILSFIMGILGMMMQTFIDNLTAIWAFVTLIFTTIYTTIFTWMTTAWNFIVQIWNKIKDTFTTMLSTINQLITTGFTTLVESIRSKLESAFNIANQWKDKIVGVINAIKDAAEAAYNAVVRAINAGANAAFGKKQYGGYIDQTGLILAHKGEYVISKDMQSGRGPVASSVQNNYQQPITINYQGGSSGGIDTLGYELAWSLRNS